MKLCNIHSGLFRNKIYIKRVARVPDGAGGFTDTWTADPADGIFAHMKMLTGTERFEAQRVHSGTLIRVIIHYRDDGNGQPYYSGADKMIYNGREYAILDVNDIEFAQQYIQMDVMEGRAT